MLRSRRATPIQDIVDGATTEDRADRRQDHRLRVGATEHLDSKSRARGERDRELGAVVSRGAGVEQQARIGGLTSFDALDDLSPFALELASVLNRRGLGGGSGGNLGGVIGLGRRRRRGRCGRRGSRSRNGLRSRRGRRRRSRGLGSRCGSGLSHRSSRSAAVPRHAALVRGRSGRSGRRRSSSTGTRDERRLLCRRRRSRNGRRGSLSSSHAHRHRGIGNPSLQTRHALSQGLNGQIGLGTSQTGAGDL